MKTNFPKKKTTIKYKPFFFEPISYKNIQKQEDYIIYIHRKINDNGSLGLRIMDILLIMLLTLLDLVIEKTLLIWILKNKLR